MKGNVSKKINNSNLKKMMKNLNEKLNNKSNKQPLINKVIGMSSFLIGYISNILILMYVLRLEKEKCECSKEGWMRDFIKYVSIFALIFPIFGYLFVPLLKTNMVTILKNKMLALLTVIMLMGIGFLGISYIVIILVYYNKLSKKTECDCSLGPKRYFLLYPLVTIFISIIFSVSSLIKEKW